MIEGPKATPFPDFRFEIPLELKSFPGGVKPVKDSAIIVILTLFLLGEGVNLTPPP